MPCWSLNRLHLCRVLSCDFTILNGRVLISSTVILIILIFTTDLNSTKIIRFLVVFREWAEPTSRGSFHQPMMLVWQRLISKCLLAAVVTKRASIAHLPDAFMTLRHTVIFLDVSCLGEHLINVFFTDANRPLSKLYTLVNRRRVRIWKLHTGFLALGEASSEITWFDLLAGQGQHAFISAVVTISRCGIRRRPQRFNCIITIALSLELAILDRYFMKFAAHGKLHVLLHRRCKSTHFDKAFSSRSELVHSSCLSVFTRFRADDSLTWCRGDNRTSRLLVWVRQLLLLFCFIVFRWICVFTSVTVFGLLLSCLSLTIWSIFFSVCIVLTVLNRGHSTVL